MENQDEKERRRLTRELEAPLRRPPAPRALRAALAGRMGADVEVIRGR